MAELDMAGHRVDYGRRSLSEADVDKDPIQQLIRWLDEAVAAKANEPNAMALATCAAGRPSVRMMLLKRVETQGLVFCTNYQSRKGAEIAENPHAAAVFWWPELERQVRIEGSLTRISQQESADYFNRRPPGARLAAAVSDQSKVLASRADLEKRLAELTAKHPAGDVACPSYWGGYRLRPLMIEFWQGGHNRLHDRLEFAFNEKAGWVMRRLAP
jgi:pyridoxamine 5'-phosphate oxidase